MNHSKQKSFYQIIETFWDIVILHILFQPRQERELFTHILLIPIEHKSKELHLNPAQTGYRIIAKCIGFK